VNKGLVSKISNNETTKKQGENLSRKLQVVTGKLSVMRYSVTRRFKAKSTFYTDKQYKNIYR